MQHFNIAPLSDRLNKTVDILKKESLEQSLRNLSEVDLFFWPGAPLSSGFGVSGSVIPLPPSFGNTDLEAIISNRRFLKIYADLQGKPQAEIEAILSEHLKRALGEYTKLFDNHMESYRSKYTLEALKDENIIYGVPFIIENAPEGKVVLSGSRLQVLSFVWLYGLLNIPDTQGAVDRVLQQALSHRESIYNDKEVVESFKLDMLTQGSLYNRQILAQAVLGSRQDEAAVLSGFNDSGIKIKTRRLTDFKASLTISDLPIRSGIMTPDYSQGELVIRHPFEMNDAQFDTLISRTKAR
jgi:hypothetical protein